MAPTLQPGQVVRVDRTAFTPRPGDIVLARHPYRRDVHIVKRVDHLTPEGRCFLVGDNPDCLETTDSRSFGAVDPERVLGRVVPPDLPAEGAGG